MKCLAHATASHLGVVNTRVPGGSGHPHPPGAACKAAPGTFPTLVKAGGICALATLGPHLCGPVPPLRAMEGQGPKKGGERRGRKDSARPNAPLPPPLLAMGEVTRQGRRGKRAGTDRPSQIGEGARRRSQSQGGRMGPTRTGNISFSGTGGLTQLHPHYPTYRTFPFRRRLRRKGGEGRGREGKDVSGHGR